MAEKTHPKRNSTSIKYLTIAVATWNVSTVEIQSVSQTEWFYRPTRKKITQPKHIVFSFRPLRFKAHISYIHYVFKAGHHIIFTHFSYFQNYLNIF